MMRLGLCCVFRELPIKFRTTTHAVCARMPRKQALLKIAEIGRHNAESLRQAIDYCAANNIGAFRINSQILPLKTHPAGGYRMRDLPDGKAIVNAFIGCGALARKRDIRLLFHPDQFILLSSVDERVISASMAELDYQAEVAEWVGADVINIHGGGVYGDKRMALARVKRNIKRLPARVRKRLTLENDDRSYTPTDLLPLCRTTATPLIYDAHHHRCRPDTMSVDEATVAALDTWDREPVFHISSPLNGWRGEHPRKHHDYIQMRDVPDGWRDLDVTIEVEAKAKELAVQRLMRALAPATRQPNS